MPLSTCKTCVKHQASTAEINRESCALTSARGNQESHGHSHRAGIEVYAQELFSVRLAVVCIRSCTRLWAAVGKWQQYVHRGTPPTVPNTSSNPPQKPPSVLWATITTSPGSPVPQKATNVTVERAVEIREILSSPHGQGQGC